MWRRKILFGNAKETLNLSFADIVDLSTFFHFSGQAILGMKLPSRNIK